MSGVRRFLSRREKSPHGPHGTRSRSQQNHATKTARRPDHFGGVFSASDESSKKTDKEEDKKIKALIERLRHYGIDNLVESNAQYALRATNPAGDPQAAFQLLMLLEDTYEGIVKPYNPDINLKGAVNRQNVTCYLDALLFAMFAKLDSFEAMLYENFEDVKRRRLAGLLRLWVNMLRTGNLITIDLTEHIQKALADLGWVDASRTRQQDPSEAFTFITGQLELPMLTLKMDMFHTGKEDPQDDHKFVNERLLEVAISDEASNGQGVVTLEDCLEHYFNNRIEVKRHMENQRRNTLKSIHSTHEATKLEKESGTHIEVVDLGDTPDTPTASTPIVETPISFLPVQQKLPADLKRPTAGRKRADSIFSQRRVELIGIDPGVPADDTSNTTTDGKGRKMSTRTEVLMPAWQFFKLLPWYTDNMPTSDAQVAAHFSKKRPVLGICLKRYSYTNTGQAQKLDTYVDIPLEIEVPNFVGDDNMDDAGSLVGNFRLMLQSVVCHRGISVNSGHYICLCRGRRPTARSIPPTDFRHNSEDSEDLEDPWMRFDDLAKERITSVDIRDALKQEMPYLLFYQVMPIDDPDAAAHDLPSYAEATSRSQSETAITLEKPFTSSQMGSEVALSHPAIPPVPQYSTTNVEVTDFAPNSERTSLDANTALDHPRGRPSSATEDGRRQNIPFDHSSYAESISGGSVRTDPTSLSISTTPSEDPPTTNNNNIQALGNKLDVSRRGSRVSRSSATSKSRPSSTDPEAGISTTRFSLNMSRLTQRVSRTEGLPDTPSVESIPVETEQGVSATVVPVSANEGRDSTSTVKPPLKVLRKEKMAAREKRRSGKPGEDRDCVVM